MSQADPTQTTRILARARDGDAAAAAELLPLVYDELRALAAGYLRRERAGHTLQPTALVNEAFLKLVDAPSLRPADRAHFLAIAATVLRRVLVEHARVKGAAKRGGGAGRVTLHSAVAVREDAPLDLLALDEALHKLAALDERQARVVEMRFFAGLSVSEVAEVIGVSKRSVELDWTLAKAFLRRELEGAAS